MTDPDGSDSVRWAAAIEHYHWDRLESAYAEIVESGIGDAGAYLPWYRLIEAELVTRNNAQRIEVSPWLSLEFVPKEVLNLGHMVDRILAACDGVARHFEWDHSEDTLIAILTEYIDGPWATYPFGYYAHKEPYEKICLPGYLVLDLEEFSQAVAHEYAHVVSESLADGHATRWLEEAIAVFMERDFDEETRFRFSEGRARWWSPAELEVALVGKSVYEDDAPDCDEPFEHPYIIEWPTERVDKEDVWLAYQQAGWIGRYLDSLGGGRAVARMLRQIADESPIWNVKRTIRGQSRVEAAIKKVYGLSTDKLFANAFEYLKGMG